MGQYHLPVNIDKREFIYPHLLNNGLKMLEWGSGGGTTVALTVLLACSHNRGGGDLRINDSRICGRWSGDRIIVLGDYTEPGDPGTDALYRMIADAERIGDHPYSYVVENFTDISMAVREVISHDDYVAGDMRELPDYMLDAASRSTTLANL
jgi:hypothetical protein